MHRSEELIFELGRRLGAKAEITSHLTHMLTAEPDRIWMQNEKLIHLPTAFRAAGNALQTFGTPSAPQAEISILFVPVTPGKGNQPANNALLLEARERTDPDIKGWMSPSDWISIAEPWLLAVEARKEIFRLRVSIAATEHDRGTGLIGLLVRSGIKKPDERFDPQPFLIHATVGYALRTDL